MMTLYPRALMVYIDGSVSPTTAITALMEHDSINLPPRGSPQLGLLADPLLSGAVARLQQRAERQEESKIFGLFVDTGVLDQLKTNTNQVFFGRRGTGKTHVMRALKFAVAASDQIVLDVDLRTLGSSAQYADPKIPVNDRALSLFRDLMIRVMDAFRVRAVELKDEAYEQAMVALSNLEASVTRPVQNVVETARTARTKGARSREESMGAGLSLKELTGTLTSKRATSNEEEDTATYAIQSNDKILFSDLTSSLTDCLALMDTKLLLLIDEWGALPPDVQPYLAEHIRHGLLPIRNICVKIASLEHRSRFSLLTSDRRVGLEIGADIFIAADLDEHYVQQRRAGQLDVTFSSVLWKHITSEIEPKHLEKQYGIRDADSLIGRLFDERSRLTDLAAASFGVTRDFLSVFARSFFEAQRKKARRIDASAVSDAIHDWFMRDKFANLPGDLQECVGDVLTAISSAGNTNLFCLPARLKDNRVVQHLIDARVIHLLDRAYTVGTALGSFHWLISVDHGLFVKRFAPRDSVATNTLEIVALLEAISRRYDTPVTTVAQPDAK